MKSFVVKQWVDNCDPTPAVSAPMTESEAIDLASEWHSQTMDHIVQHSLWVIPEHEYDEIAEIEWSLIKIEEV